MGQTLESLTELARLETGNNLVAMDRQVIVTNGFDPKSEKDGFDFWYIYGLARILEVSCPNIPSEIKVHKSIPVGTILYVHAISSASDGSWSRTKYVLTESAESEHNSSNAAPFVTIIVEKKQGDDQMFWK